MTLLVFALRGPGAAPMTPPVADVTLQARAEIAGPQPGGKLTLYHLSINLKGTES
jgi:hypothetical protein